MDAWGQGQYFLVTSPSIIAEIRAVLGYPRITKKYFVSRQDIEQMVSLLQRDALVVPGTANVKGAIPDDPKDEKFLAGALDAGADLIVSGDRHLLNLAEYEDVPILTVHQFAERLEKTNQS